MRPRDDLKVTLSTTIHAPDQIRGGKNPNTSTVIQILDDAYRYTSWRCAELENDLGLDLTDDNDEPLRRAPLTLGHVRTLLDDPNAEMVAMTGDQLRAARKVLGLTQEELADRLGNARTTVRDWERGAFPIPPRLPSELAVIAEARIREIQELRDSL